MGRRKKRDAKPSFRPGIDSEYGIEARSFDKTIEDMSRIQEEIIWGGNE